MIMNAAEVMDSNPPTLKPTDTIEYAVQFITTHRYRNLPVVDVEGHYLGSARPET
jgi:CBS domain-containing protein